MKLAARLFAATTAATLTVGGLARAAPSDFDFNLGVWKTHIRRATKPLTDPKAGFWLDGTVTVRPLWEGGSLEEIEADGPKGHWEGLTLFLWNPKTRQWGQFFANSAQGVLGLPSVGEFHQGTGELVSADTLAGRAILVKGVWSPKGKDAHRYQELYSDDIGKTWHPAFTADLTRLAKVAPAAKVEPDLAHHAGSHDFDFELGKWRIHTRKLLRPLSGSHEWIERDGVTDIEPVWGGKANLVHLQVHSAAEGEIEMSALRLYDPTAHQWSIHFATPANGDLGPPLIGEFHDGRGVFYDQEPIGGRTIWVRLTVYPLSRDEVQTEQAFSADQGRTWETNQVSHSTRLAQVDF